MNLDGAYGPWRVTRSDSFTGGTDDGGYENRNSNVDVIIVIIIIINSKAMKSLSWVF